jgi:hypothetical protein
MPYVAAMESFTLSASVHVVDMETLILTTDWLKTACVLSALFW